jgi:hypothetical protein
MSKMNRIFLVLVLAVGLILVASDAKAGSTVFTFDTLAAGSTTSQIDNYMSNIYGSNVSVANCHIEVNHGSSNHTNWPGNTTPYLSTQQAVTMSISFTQIPITSFSSIAHIFSGNDLDATGLDANGNVVATQTYSFSGKPPDTFNIGLNFNSPVTTLTFSDSGFNDVAIDNLTLNGPSTPEPSTVVLCGVGGAMLVGWNRLRRRYAA